MHLEGYQDVFFIITYGLAIVSCESAEPVARWRGELSMTFIDSGP